LLALLAMYWLLRSGSVGWMREWGDGWSSALFYYGDDALIQYRYERLDDEPTTAIQNRYDSRHRLSVSAELEF